LEKKEYEFAKGERDLQKKKNESLKWVKEEIATAWFSRFFGGRRRRRGKDVFKEGQIVKFPFYQKNQKCFNLLAQSLYYTQKFVFGICAL
jgi:hypothetical protein